MFVDKFFVSETSFFVSLFCLGFYVDNKEREKIVSLFFVSVFMLTAKRDRKVVSFFVSVFYVDKFSTRTGGRPLHRTCHAPSIDHGPLHRTLALLP